MGYVTTFFSMDGYIITETPMGKHNLSYYAVMLLAAIAVIFFVLYLRKKPSSPSSSSSSPSPSTSRDAEVESYVPLVEDVVDDFQLIGIEPNEQIPEMAVSFGMGPGIYGNNRNFTDSIFIKDPNLAPYN